MPVTTTTKKATSKATKKAAPKKKAGQPCTCGCKGITGGGRFLPGHDAKLKGILKRAMADGGLSAENKALVRQLGWERFLNGGDSPKSKAKSMVSVPQRNVLRALKAKPDGMSQGEIEAAIGNVKPEEVKKLLKSKMVSVSTQDVNGRDIRVYRIAANGHKALDKEVTAIK